MTLINSETNTRSMNGDTGTQINKGGAIVGANGVLHTVTAAKDFYLRSLSLSTDSTTTGTKVEVRNAADAVQSIVMMGNSQDCAAMNKTFATPIKMAAGYDVYLTQPNTATTTSWTINGWEETA